jgi:CRP/FNR family cyclic AMP-dependent transcriptional regulator
VDWRAESEVPVTFAVLLPPSSGRLSDLELEVGSKISPEMLAEMIGTNRSRVSFFMNSFRKLGFIEYNGEIRIHNTLLNIFLQE